MKTRPIRFECSCGGTMDHFYHGIDLDSYQCSTCKAINDWLACCGVRLRVSMEDPAAPPTCPACKAIIRDAAENRPFNRS